MKISEQFQTFFEERIKRISTSIEDIYCGFSLIKIEDFPALKMEELANAAVKGGGVKLSAFGFNTLFNDGKSENIYTIDSGTLAFSMYFGSRAATILNSLVTTKSSPSTKIIIGSESMAGAKTVKDPNRLTQKLTFSKISFKGLNFVGGKEKSKINTTVIFYFLYENLEYEVLGDSGTVAGSTPDVSYPEEASPASE